MTRGMLRWLELLNSRIAQNENIMNKRISSYIMLTIALLVFGFMAVDAYSKRGFSAVAVMVVIVVAVAGITIGLGRRRR